MLRTIINCHGHARTLDKVYPVAPVGNEALEKSRAFLLPGRGWDLIVCKNRVVCKNQDRVSDCRI